VLRSVEDAAVDIVVVDLTEAVVDIVVVVDVVNPSAFGDTLLTVAAVVTAGVIAVAADT
jgi:hypothetical protein